MKYQATDPIVIPEHCWTKEIIAEFINGEAYNAGVLNDTDEGIFWGEITDELAERFARDDREMRDEADSEEEFIQGRREYCVSLLENILDRM